MEQTLSIIKPDAVKKNVIGKIKMDKKSLRLSKKDLNTNNNPVKK